MRNHGPERILSAVNDGAQIDDHLAGWQLLAYQGGWQLGIDPGWNEVRIESQILRSLAF